MFLQVERDVDFRKPWKGRLGVVRWRFNAHQFLTVWRLLVPWSEYSAFYRPGSPATLHDGWISRIRHWPAWVTPHRVFWHVAELRRSAGQADRSEFSFERYSFARFPNNCFLYCSFCGYFRTAKCDPAEFARSCRHPDNTSDRVCFCCCDYDISISCCDNYLATRGIRRSNDGRWHSVATDFLDKCLQHFSAVSCFDLDISYNGFKAAWSAANPDSCSWCCAAFSIRFDVCSTVLKRIWELLIQRIAPFLAVNSGATAVLAARTNKYSSAARPINAVFHTRGRLFQRVRYNSCWRRLTFRHSRSARRLRYK